VNIDFTAPDASSPWYIINDNVMGGKSIGFISTKNQKGSFSGTISLENNGGFSSTLIPIKTINNEFKRLSIDIQGDGLSYQIRAIVNNDGYRLAYKYPFTTRKNKREQITVLLEDFQGVFRGRHIENAPKLRANDIIELGFLHSSKQAGDFSLIIHNISMCDL
jgi:hypothetical protein